MIPHDNQFYALNSWMSSLSQEMKRKPINELTIPGTHDSAAYTLDFKKTLGGSPLLFKIVNFVADQIPLIGKIISDWTITQNQSIREQLEMGIRQLDLRVSYCEESKKFYLLHTFTCIPLDEALDAISQFLESNKGEIVIINMKADWPHKEFLATEIEQQLLDHVQEKFGETLCSRTPSDEFNKLTTLANMVEEGRRIIFSYGKHTSSTEDTSAVSNFNWKRENFDTPWPDSSDVEVSVKAMKASLDADLSPDKMRGISFTLTPQPLDIIAAIFKQIFSLFMCKWQTLETLTEKIHGVSSDFLNENTPLIKKNVSIISTDFANEDFVRSIIEINF